MLTIPLPRLPAPCQIRIVQSPIPIIKRWYLRQLIATCRRHFDNLIQVGEFRRCDTLLVLGEFCESLWKTLRLEHFF